MPPPAPTPPPASRPGRSAGSVVGAVVGVLVNTAGGYSRGVLRGITSFAVSRAWRLRVQGVNESDIEQAAQDLDGVIVQASTPTVARRFLAISRRGIPVVNVSSSLAEPGLVTVMTDDREVGRLGADHFLRAGFRSLLFYAPDRRAFARLRQAGFADRAHEANVAVRTAAAEPELSGVLRRLADGSFDLPRPLGVMGCNDRASLQVLEACRLTRLRVPEDVAVLGVDDDDLIQALAFVPLSSVNTARDRVGFEAAARLERLITARPAPSQPAGPVLLVPPKGVVARRSTDASAVTDTDVAEAARFIQANAGRPIGVRDVVAAATVSRRQLERRFRLAMGHSLLDELTRRRVDRARQLLVDTELTLDQIARAAGFSSASYFSVVFKRSAGLSPQKYRETYRSPQG